MLYFHLDRVWLILPTGSKVVYCRRKFKEQGCVSCCLEVVMVCFKHFLNFIFLLHFVFQG